MMLVLVVTCSHTCFASRQSGVVNVQWSSSCWQRVGFRQGHSSIVNARRPSGHPLRCLRSRSVMLLQFWGCQASIVTLRSSCKVAWGRARWKPYTSQECLASTDFAPVVPRPTQYTSADRRCRIIPRRFSQSWPTHDKSLPPGIPLIAGILPGIAAASEA